TWTYGRTRPGSKIHRTKAKSGPKSACKWPFAGFWPPWTPSALAAADPDDRPGALEVAQDLESPPGSRLGSDGLGLHPHRGRLRADPGGGGAAGRIASEPP